MLRAKRIKLDGKRPFSMINPWTTSMAMGKYLKSQSGGRQTEEIARNPEAFIKGKGK
jgi:hypothetical protein